MKKLLSLLAFAAIIILSSCSDDDATDTTAPLTLHFDNVVGTANLQLNTTDYVYTNAKSESYNVSTLKYYVSNIILKKADGSTFIDPVKSDGSAGYYLIDESNEASQDVSLKNIPVGEYTGVTFTIGVDASQVNQGAQTGALDPANGLFWSWNSGYIFMMLEGASTASTEKGNEFAFHVGGYKDDAGSSQVNNIRTVTLNFTGDTAPVRAQHEPEVHLLFDVTKFLNGTGEQVTFSANAARHSPMACKDLANNIAGAFVVDHIHAN